MHESSAEKMKELLERYCPPDSGRKVLEIGSYLYGTESPERPQGYPDGWPDGGYRELIMPNRSPGGMNRVAYRGTYQGLDIQPGPNVDIVAPDHYHWPVDDAAFDLVISGQCMEHVEDLHAWMAEVFRVCVAGGLCIHIAPSAGTYHAFPVHCWMIMKDGMRFLLTLAGFEVLEAEQWDKHPWNDCWGVGRKPV